MNWEFLNSKRVSLPGYPDTDASWGFNGAFQFMIRSSRVKCIASDGEGWRHVSVSLADHPSATPRWDVMCAVKDLFWEPTDWVAQFHPAQSEYVNFHAGCLHLWQCIDGREMPTPPAWMVGPKVKVKV